MKSAKWKLGPSDDPTIKACRYLLLFALFGVAAIIIYASTSGAVAKIIGVCLLTAGASMAVGALLGFIFGVPKSPHAPETTTTTSASPAGSAGSTERAASSDANTNLQQISDWLTKTIVGVSLVELNKLPHLLNELATYVAAAIGDANPDAKAVALVVMVYFFSTGFLISYLWTRWELTDISRMSNRLEDLEQLADDADAIKRVDEWLTRKDLTKEEEARARSEMTDAIKKSSDVAKSKIFVTAYDYKRNTPARKEDIQKASERTLPIFQALVEADRGKVHHRNRAQYAFSLMTQPTPDWKTALDVIGEAIKIRDRTREPGWPEYEFARAICRINLKPGAKQEIEADLRKADELNLSPGTRERLDLDGAVDKWEKANKPSGEPAK